MRRHICSHTYGNTTCSVYQQQRNLGRQNGRLLQGLIEVGCPIDSLLIDVSHNLIGNLLHTCLGITHSRCRVTVHRTEVTLALNQRITHSPILCHTYHSLINRTITVGVELTQHITHDTRRLTGRLIRIEIKFGTHIVQNTTMNRLQTITHIGQCTRNDNRHRVVDIGRLHLLFDIDRDDSPRQTDTLFFFIQHSFLFSKLAHFSAPF